jgi:hypothetical protein
MKSKRAWSGTARTLWLCVRMLLESWMYVDIFLCCAVLFKQSTCDRSIKESYRNVWRDSEIQKLILNRNSLKRLSRETNINACTSRPMWYLTSQRTHFKTSVFKTEASFSTSNFLFLCHRRFNIWVFVLIFTVFHSWKLVYGSAWNYQWALHGPCVIIIAQSV